MYHHSSHKNRLFIMKYITIQSMRFCVSKIPSGGRPCSRIISCLQCAHIQLISYAQSGHNPCLYIPGLGLKRFVVYMDDLLLFSIKWDMASAKKELAGKFEMHDLGEVHWFLAMEITCDQTAQTISIDQCQYIWKIVGHFELNNMQLETTLMATNLKLLKL